MRFDLFISPVLTVDVIHEQRTSRIETTIDEPGTRGRVIQLSQLSAIV
jgi:hypothetical protein